MQYVCLTKHELRDPKGNLIFRGTMEMCYNVMAQLGNVEFGKLLEGWTLLPYQIETYANE